MAAFFGAADGAGGGAAFSVASFSAFFYSFSASSAAFAARFSWFFVSAAGASPEIGAVTSADVADAPSSVNAPSIILLCFVVVETSLGGRRDLALLSNKNRACFLKFKFLFNCNRVPKRRQ